MKYKISIDVAEGKGTLGKTTPPLPREINKTENGITVQFNKNYKIPEHYANAGVAMYLKEALERCGQECFMVCYSSFDKWADDCTMSDNVNQDVIKRQGIIRASNSDVSVSLHHNAYGNGTFNTARGIEMYCHSVAAKVGDSKRFAETIWKYVSKATSPARSLKFSSSYGMCNAVGMNVKAACIIEHAFMTNEADVYDKMTSPIAWKAVAEAECQGICEYLGVEYVKPVEAKPSDVGQPVPLVLYEVQAGAFAVKENALAQCKRLSLLGISTYIKYSEKLYKVIAGTYSVHANAIKQSKYLTDLKIPNFIRRCE